jgi:hypothetical protein
MTIEIGDTVQLKNKNSQIFGALLVLDIIRNKAKCAFRLLDKPMDGDERPNSIETVTDSFDIEDLELLRKKQVIESEID